jgi:2'-5' RNA ligase
MARVRTFIGVAIGESIRKNAVALQQSLAKSGAAVKWVESENLHVTLLFLGEVNERELAALCRTVSAAVASEPPFTLRVGGVGAFPNARRPKTIWVGITEGADELIRLHARIEPLLLELGCYRSEGRAYSPHLTLGRVKAEADGHLLAAELPRYRDWSGGQTVVDEVVLFASELRREGPVYTVLGRGELHGR